MGWHTGTGGRYDGNRRADGIAYARKGWAILFVSRGAGSETGWRYEIELH